MDHLDTKISVHEYFEVETLSLFITYYIYLVVPKGTIFVYGVLLLLLFIHTLDIAPLDNICEIL